MFRWQTVGLAIVFLWFMVGGVTHFTSPEFFVNIMPPYVGWHLEIVYISGILEILGALGILVPKTRQWAGNCLILLTLAVTPANIHMWMHPRAVSRRLGNGAQRKVVCSGVIADLYWVVYQTVH